LRPIRPNPFMATFTLMFPLPECALEMMSWD
jgi:hypothetical protein